MDEPRVSETSRRPRGGGTCLLRGCLVVMIAAMLLGVVIGSVGWYVYRYVQPFFSREPVPIRQFEGGDAGYALTQAKLAEFNRTTAGGQQATLTLTADDLNALIAYDPRLADLRGRLYVSIVNNQLVVEASYPWSGDPRTPPDQRVFFSWRAVLDASYSSRDLTFLLARLETLDGKEPPAFLFKLARRYVSNYDRWFSYSLHEHPERNEDLRQVTDQFRTIIIQDNQIVAASRAGTTRE